MLCKSGFNAVWFTVLQTIEVLCVCAGAITYILYIMYIFFHLCELYVYVCLSITV